MNRILTACYFAACLLSASLLHAQQIRIVALTGDPMPRGDGVFTGFGQVVLGDSGDVAFEGSGQLSGTPTPTNTQGIFTGDGVSPLHAVAQLGDLAPNNSPITNLLYPAINASGQVAYNLRTISSTSYVVEDQDVVVNRASGGDGRSDGPGNVSVNEFDRPHLANTGALTFGNRLAGVSPRLGVFQTQTNVTSTIARDGELTPTGDLLWLYGSAGQESDFSVNPLGQVAIFGPVRKTDSGVYRNGLFLVDGDSVYEYPVFGASVPNGNGVITTISELVLNDQQSVAFIATLTGTANGSADRNGIFRATGTDLIELMRTGDPAPIGPGNIRRFESPQLNAHGHVLAEATFTAGVSTADTGFILADETGIYNVARAGTMLADGSRFYTAVRDASLNDLGQVAFTAEVGTNPYNGNSVGIFLYEAGDTRTIALTGTPFLGSTITELTLFSVTDFDYEYLSSSRRTFNNLGQVAYRFTLADGRKGIAVWSVPEVPTGYLAIAASLAIVSLRPRIRTSTHKRQQALLPRR